jgi:hypothetical protein
MGGRGKDGRCRSRRGGRFSRGGGLGDGGRKLSALLAGHVEQTPPDVKPAVVFASRAVDL